MAVQPRALLVICGPSGAGKSTLVGRLIGEFPDDVAYSVSHTSRSPRSGERDGVDYHFSSLEEMEGMAERGEFVERATFGGNMYGTSFEALKREDKLLVLDVDLQGMLAISRCGEFAPTYVWVTTRTHDELLQRLHKRGEKSDFAEKRLEIALKDEKEMLRYIEPLGMRVLVNEQVDVAYAWLRGIVVGML